MLSFNMASVFNGNLGSTQFLPHVLILEPTLHVSYDSHGAGWMGVMVLL